MPAGSEKFGIPADERPYGVGKYKTVHEDPRHPDRVLAFKKDGVRNFESVDTRERYYLTKIAHLLFPDNIPDIHFSYSQPDVSSRQKVDLGQAHNTMRDAALKREVDHAELSEVEKIEYNDARGVIWSNPEVHRLKAELEVAGIKLDHAGQNFGLDEGGNAKYVDGIDISFPRADSLIKLQKFIGTKLQGNDLARAKIFLRRLADLIYGRMEVAGLKIEERI